MNIPFVDQYGDIKSGSLNILRRRNRNSALESYLTHLRYEQEKQIEIDAAVKESGLEEINEIYEQTKKNITADEKLKGRRAMIFAIVLALFVLAVNIASGYMN